MSIYICSDIHGQHKLYKQMLEEIRFSETDQLFILGDVIDRGPDSVELLLDIMGRNNVTCLLGNHELMMWEYLHRNPEEDTEDTLGQSLDWIRKGNGGLETLHQFMKLPSENQTQCLNYIKDMYLQYELQLPNHTYMLSHSFFVQDEGTLKWQDTSLTVVFEVVWRSPWRIWEYVDRTQYQDGCVHIVGHVHLQAVHDLLEEFEYDWKPEAFIEEDGSIINIDCGCSLVSTKKSRYAGLCCMDLTAYDEGASKNAFHYFWAPEPGSF